MEEKTTFLLILFAVAIIFQNINLDFKPFYDLLFQCELIKIDISEAKKVIKILKKMCMEARAREECFQVFGTAGKLAEDEIYFLTEMVMDSDSLAPSRALLAIGGKYAEIAADNLFNRLITNGPFPSDKKLFVKQIIDGDDVRNVRNNLNSLGMLAYYAIDLIAKKYISKDQPSHMRKIAIELIYYTYHEFDGCDNNFSSFFSLGTIKNFRTKLDNSFKKAEAVINNIENNTDEDLGVRLYIKKVKKAYTFKH